MMKMQISGRIGKQQVNFSLKIQRTKIARFTPEQLHTLEALADNFMAARVCNQDNAEHWEGCEQAARDLIEPVR